MKKIFFYLKNHYINILIIINILYILISTYLYAINISNMEKFSHGFIILEIINAISFITVYIKKHIFHKVDILIPLIIIFSLISTALAFNKEVAVFGYSKRYEGLLSILYYLSLFSLSTYSKNKKLIIYTIIFSGLCPYIYLLFDHFQLFGIQNIRTLHNIWTTGFTTNSNFYGTFMLICLSYSIGLYIEESDEIKNYIFILLCFLFIVALLYSNTLGCLIGLFAVMIILLWYCIINKKIKKYLFLLLIIISVFFFMNYKNSTNLYKDLKVTNNEISKISKGSIEDKYGSGRMYIWKNAAQEIPKYLWHGIGIDNFAYIKDGHFIRYETSSGTTLFDKAHCEYLQILLTQGIFSLLSYLIFYIIVITNGIKNSFKNKQIYLLLPIIGYLIQAIFNISVIEVAPIFYIAMGLNINR